MRESEESTFATVAREVMGPAHSPAIIEAMATHAAELVHLRRAAAGNIVAIGTRINDCLYLIKDAIVAVAGDTLEARQDSANKLFAFLAKSAEMSRAVARQY